MSQIAAGAIQMGKYSTMNVTCVLGTVSHLDAHTYVCTRPICLEAPFAWIDS